MTINELKRHSTLFLKTQEKILKNRFTNMTPIAILSSHQVKKVPGKKIHTSFLESQISAILFQANCAIRKSVWLISPISRLAATYRAMRAS